MDKYLETNENGIIWVKSEKYGVTVGVVDSAECIDGDGLYYSTGTLETLDNLEFDIMEDWENEQTIVNLEDTSGNPIKLIFCGDDIEIEVVQ